MSHNSPLYGSWWRVLHRTSPAVERIEPEQGILSLPLWHFRDGLSARLRPRSRWGRHGLFLDAERRFDVAGVGERRLCEPGALNIAIATASTSSRRVLDPCAMRALNDL